MKPPQIVFDGANLYRFFCRIADFAQSPLLLAVRLYWGWQLMQAGWGKLHNLARVTHYFASLGIPFPAFTTHFVAEVELIGGILLILGLFSRLAGLVIAIDMVVAYWTGDHQAWLSFLRNPGAFYGADPYTFLFAGLLILIFGAGLFSCDQWLDSWMTP